MERRAYLTLLLAASAGCLGGDRNRDTVRLVSSGEVPSQFGTDVRVDVVEPEITLPRPARIRITVRNTSERRREYGFDSTHPPLGRVVGEAVSGSRTILLADPESVSRRLATCWRPVQTEPDGDATRVELAAGEAIQNTLTLWDLGTDETTCFPPGDYRFATGFEHRDRTVDLEFTLRLEEEE